MIESFSLFAGWLIDGTGQPLQENIFIRVQQGLIHSVRQARQADMYAPDLVNCPHATLLPALLDAHVRLCMSGTTAEEPRRKQLSFDFDTAISWVRTIFSGWPSAGSIGFLPPTA